MIFGTFIVLFMPETLHLRVSPSTGQLISPSPAERNTSQQQADSSTAITTVKSQIKDALTRTYNATTILKSKSVLLLLLTFIANPFCSQSIGLSVRYISKRFTWKIRQTMILLSLRAFVNIILLLVLIPLISRFLINRLGLSSKGKDLCLARSSALFLAAGSIFLAASDTIPLTILSLVIWTLGTGFASLTRSLITTLVDQAHVGKLYAAITIVETLGALIAGPFLNWLYKVGLGKGGMWVGMPFYCLAVVCGVAGTGVWCFGAIEKDSFRAKSGYVRVDGRGEDCLDVLEGLGGEGWDGQEGNLIELEPESVKVLGDNGNR
jgi:hypothetical protein